jgi:hypothetical protein
MSAGTLRGIVAEAGDPQTIFVYDDPMPDNLEHVVMRGRQSVAKALRRAVRDMILDTVGRTVSP